MTKEQAKKELLENGRAVIDPEYAEQLLEPFGHSLKSLGLKTHKTKQFQRLNYSKDVADLPSVAVFEMAQDLAQKLTGVRVSSPMYGRGSYADDITKKAVALI